MRARELVEGGEGGLCGRGGHASVNACIKGLFCPSVCSKE